MLFQLHVELNQCNPPFISGYGGYWGGPQILWSDWGYGNNYADWWGADYVFFRAAKAKAIANMKAKTQG